MIYLRLDTIAVCELEVLGERCSLRQDTAAEMVKQVSLLLSEMLNVNHVSNEDLISIILTATS